MNPFPRFLCSLKSVDRSAEKTCVLRIFEISRGSESLPAKVQGKYILLQNQHHQEAQHHRFASLKLLFSRVKSVKPPYLHVRSIPSLTGVPYGVRPVVAKTLQKEQTRSAKDLNLKLRSVPTLSPAMLQATTSPYLSALQAAVTNQYRPAKPDIDDFCFM